MSKIISYRCKGKSFSLHLCLFKTIKSETGSFAVVTALFLIILIGILAFVLNLGYLYAEKNKYQNAVEAAAMAGVTSLCNGDLDYVESIIRQIAEENSIAEEKGSLIIEFGFYDEMDDYTDFSIYKDFVTEENMPSGEYINAVYVSYQINGALLTDMGYDASSSNASVAYLQRIDMVSLDSQGAIHIGHNSTWEKVIFFSNGDIMYPQAATITTGTLNPPEFDNCRLYAVGDIDSCPVEKETYFWGSKERIAEILWNSGAPQSGSHIYSGIDPITNVRPVDDEYLEDWRDQADVVYTPDQAGKDTVFYKSDEDQYYFDPAGENGVIFFDAGGSSQAKVFIGREYDHAPNGETITNLTFVANCAIQLVNRLGTSWSMPDETLYVGGKEEDQTVFISTDDIEVNPTAGQRIKFDGTVFRTGGDFILIDGGSSFDQKIRIIADGSILGKNSVGTSSYAGGIDIGLFSIDNNSCFGPPCPPNIPKLGLLIPTSSD